MSRLNNRLPEALKMEKVTGHSGRHTLASIAVNSGVDSNHIAKVTHHKDPRALSLYQREDEATRLSAAMAIGAAVRRVTEISDEHEENNEDNEEGSDEEESQEESVVTSIRKRHCEGEDLLSSTKKKQMVGDVPTINFFFSSKK